MLKIGWYPVGKMLTAYSMPDPADPDASIFTGKHDCHPGVRKIPTKRCCRPCRDSSLGVRSRHLRILFRISRFVEDDSGSDGKLLRRRQVGGRSVFQNALQRLKIAFHPSDVLGELFVGHSEALEQSEHDLAS